MPETLTSSQIVELQEYLKTEAVCKAAGVDGNRIRQAIFRGANLRPEDDRLIRLQLRKIEDLIRSTLRQ